MKQTPTKAAGFTLIELLIALGLMAIFALLAYRGLDSVLRLNSAAQSHDARAAARLRVVTQLEADLRQAQRTTLVAGDSGTQSLHILRRAPTDGGAANVLTAVWTLENGTLSRSTGEQNAPLLTQVTQLAWLAHQATPLPTSAPWQPIAPQANAGAADVPVRRAVMMQLTHQGQAFEKAFLIGK